MSIKTIEDVLDYLAEAIAEHIGSESDDSTASDDESTYSKDDIKEFIKDNDLDKNDVKPVLKEHGFKSPGHIDEDYEEMDQLYADIAELVEADPDDPDEYEELTVDMVKETCQAYAKENSKEDLTEILEPYGIKSVRGLKNLDEEDLGKLYEELTE